MEPLGRRLARSLLLGLVAAVALAPVSPGAASPATGIGTASVHASLSLGDTGPEVVRLQRRLAALGYWLGRNDGRFGDATQQAVFALQKVAGIARDGVVGPRTRRALDEGVRPAPRSRRGAWVEIDLSRDVVMFVSDGTLRSTLNTSTGGGFAYWQNGASGVAITPTGRFRVYSEVNGMRISPLGELWRPKFFHGGYAIHGSASVPPYPASHGCVRVSNEAIDWIWSRNLLPIGARVWIYR